MALFLWAPGPPASRGSSFFPRPLGAPRARFAAKKPAPAAPSPRSGPAGAGCHCAAHHGPPSQRGAAPTMERAMKNIAEFTIIGRVSNTKTLGKTVRVTIASNYRLKDERGAWREGTFWNEVTV